VSSKALVFWARSHFRFALFFKKALFSLVQATKKYFWPEESSMEKHTNDKNNTHFWDELAIESYNTILKQFPKNPQKPLIYKNLGLAYTRVNRLNKALRAFQKAIKEHKEFAEAYYHLATVYQMMGKKVEAVRCFTNYRKFSKKEDSESDVVSKLLDQLKSE
jgi:tetratricopeptide (TPR) repeat protein